MKDPESRQDTSEKIKEALNIDIQLSISRRDDTYFYQPQSSLISARLQWPRRLSSCNPIAIDYKVKTDAFVDDDTFIPHFIKCFGKRHTEIK
jgi:1-acyl-sn-glycerol-3-phosphate acyltransferase